MNRDEVYRLAIKDLNTKKRRTLYHICGHCLHNLKHRRFKMIKRSNPRTTNWSRLFVEGLVKGKSQQLYDILPEQIEVIEGLETKKEKLVLKSKERKRIWTVFNIRDLIENDTNEMLNLMHKLFDYQTDDEKDSRRTKWQNAVGFNQPDASFLTGMSRIYETKGKTKEAFTDSQIRAIRKRMMKYAQQITTILNC